MMNPLRLLLLLLPVAVQTAQAQTSGTREITGQVVEITDGVAKGVAGITVSIVDFDYDITKADGSFRLPLPPGRDYVTITIENTQRKMISPYSGLVNLPPDPGLQIIVCGEQNRKLLQQVDRLNGRVKKLERDKQLSSRQIAQLHKTLLDTILYYENVIGQMSESIQQKEQENVALNAEVAGRDARIRALQDSVQVLVQALGDALAERFLHQKAVYDQVSADLLEYLDRLKDLRDHCLPKQMSYCFSNPQASADLKKTIEAYDEIREQVLKSYKGLVLATREYWDNPEVARTVESTYRFLLNDIHRDQVLPINTQVFDPLRQYTSGQTGRVRAEKDTEKAANALIPKLSSSILELERKIQDTLAMMNNNI